MNKIIISSLVVVMLCACGITKKRLGIEKNSPDEMMVVSRAPLSIPPEFGLRPIVIDVQQADNEAELSTGEQILLKELK